MHWSFACSQKPWTSISDVSISRTRFCSQAAFQHAELVSKRCKVETIEKTMAQDAMSRENAIRACNEKICKMRERLATLDEVNGMHQKMTPETRMGLIKLEMQEINSERLWNDWPRIIEQKAVAITTEAQDVHNSSDEFSRVLLGYRKNFGLSFDDGSKGGQPTSTDAVVTMQE
jgi:hypothetical protein